jgi:amino acid adenylation domain-containing protein
MPGSVRPTEEALSGQARPGLVQSSQAQAKLADDFDLLSVNQFLRHLRRLGIEIRANEVKLSITAPAGAVTQELQEELRRRKPELMARLMASDALDEERCVPLTYAQQRLWLIDRFSPGTAAYNIPQSWIIDGVVDPAALRAALNRLAARHQALRTRIEVRDGEAVQVVLKEVEIPLDFTDLSESTDTDSREAQLRQLLKTEARQPFILSEAPLIRFHMFRLEASRYAVAYNMHHIAADQWSLDKLKRDVSALYTEVVTGQAAELPALTVQYPDIAEEERSGGATLLHARQLDYWGERLRGVPALLELPFSKTRPAEQSYEGATLAVSLSAHLTQQLRRLAASSNTSLYMLMLTAFLVLLHRYTGQKDLCIGTPISGRKRVEEEDVIGLFVNMLALRCEVDPSASFRQLLQRTGDQVLADFEHGDIPFQKLVMELHPHRSPSHTPLFQIMFALNPRGAGSGDPQEEVYIGVSKFDLTLQMAERQDTLDAYFEYRTDLFAEADVEQFSRHFVLLAESVAMAPDEPVGLLGLLTPEDRAAFQEWNATEVSFDRKQTLISLFEEQVEHHSDSVALLCGTNSYTFRELNEKAGGLVALLRQNGVQAGSFVALCLDRTPQLIVSILAILKAGAAYLPLDPKYPEERLAYMLMDSGARVMIAQRNALTESLKSNHPELVLIYAEDDASYSDGGLCLVESAAIDPEDAAYLIYTSGSTGKPKGVVVEHRNAVALIAWAISCFDEQWLRGMLASTSVCFDLSIFEIFLPLSTGNTIVLVNDVLELPKSPHAGKVTLVNTVPSAMSALLQAGLPPAVRTVCMAGELLPTELVDRVYATGAERVFDLYGPTETTTYSTWALRQPGAPPTIGKPIGNTRIYLLDENLSQVPRGAMGEVFIGGDGVTRGYLGRPDLTAERFRSIPAVEPQGRLYRTGDLARQLSDGTLVYLGRRDHQIKLRGHRIELGEIEAALRDISGESQLAVVVQSQNAGDQLVAFVARGDRSHADLPQYMAGLRKRLPAYMVPSRIVLLEAMPLTPNGKIDRKALILLKDAAAGSEAGAHVSEPPRDLLEQWLANIWAQRLGRKRVSRHEDFFDDLGGHSLVAFEIFAEIERRLGLVLMLATLFQAPTIELLAMVIRRRGFKEPRHIALVTPGIADKVIYLAGPSLAGQSRADQSRSGVLDGLSPSGERVMAFHSEGTPKDIDACARELALIEATKPPLVLVATYADSEHVRRLTLALTHHGFSDISLRSL